jgi:hypothetical protein
MAIISPAPPGKVPSKAVPGSRFANRRNPIPIMVVRTNIASTSPTTGTQLLAMVCNDLAVMASSSD